MPNVSSMTFSARMFARLRHLSFRVLRPVTLGTQGVVIDRDNRILLVRHTYVPGWHFPGGGVEPGETVRQALERELREEANIKLLDPPTLHGVFHNDRFSTRDHVVVFIVRQFEQTQPRPPDYEIAEIGFFAYDALPEATTHAARTRLAEILESVPVAGKW